MAASAVENDELRFPLSGKYDIERVIGRGGMGTVFQARHTRLGHLVAIKMLGASLRGSAELVERFEREARAAGSLSSPHAVRIFDIETTPEGTPFMVMELLTGRDLACLLEHGGAQPIGVAVRWIIEACDAIAEAHRLGIIHRDIKPSNLLLCQDSGSIKVLDFGIAKRVAAAEASLTVGLALLGTPQYMSPEQIRCAKNVDARSDIWSLGVTLYELVTGRPPYDHDVPQACIAAIVADPFPDPRELRPDLPEGLAAVIVRALAKDREQRFQSVDELVRALVPFVDGAPSNVSSPALPEAPRPKDEHAMRGPMPSVRFAAGVVFALALLVSTKRVADSPSMAPRVDAVGLTAAGTPRKFPPKEEVVPVTTTPPNEGTPKTWKRVGEADASTTPRAPTRRLPLKPLPPPYPTRGTTVARGAGGDRTVHGGISSPGF